MGDAKCILLYYIFPISILVNCSKLNKSLFSSTISAPVQYMTIIFYLEKRKNVPALIWPAYSLK